MKFYQPTILGFLNFIIPAITALASATAGAVKAHNQNNQRKKDIDQRNKRRMFAAFTGDMPQGDDPEKASYTGNMLGGATTGLALGSSINSMVNPDSIYAKSLGNKALPNNTNPYSLGTFNPNMPMDDVIKPKF